MSTIRFLGALITGLTIILLALALRLASGPISLGPVAPLVEDFIADLDTEVSIQLEDMSLVWDRTEQTIALRLDAVRIIDRTGQRLASIPHALLAFDIPALLTGTPRPTRIDVRGLALRLVRDSSGELGFGLEPGDQSDQSTEPSPVPALLDAIVADDPQSPFSRLKVIRFTDASGILDDRRLGRTFRAPRINVAVRRVAGGLDAGFDGLVELDGDLVGARVSLGIDTAAATADIMAVVDGLRPAHIGLFLPSASGDVSGIQLPMRAQLTGRANARQFLTPIGFVIESVGGSIKLPALGEEVIRPDRILADGELTPDLGRISLRAAEIVVDDLTLRLGGEIAFGDGGPAIDLVANIDALSVAGLKRHWPAAVAKDARDWIVGNILAGQIFDARARIKATGPELEGKVPLPANAVAMEYRVEGVEVRYFKPLPTVTAIKGRARMNAHRLDIDVASGRVGELAVRDGVIIVTDLHKKDQFADIKVVVDGPVPAALALLDRDPLRFIRRFDLDPAATSGTATTRARFKFPLAKNLAIDDLDVAADSDISGFSYPKVYDRFAVADGALNLKVDRRHLSARGRMSLNKVPAQIMWVENFDGKPFASRYDLTALVDDEGRDALGFPTGEALTGTIGADVSIEVARGGNARIDAALDLTDGVLTASPLGWQKKKGDKASGRIAVDMPPGVPARITGAEITGTDFAAKARGQLGPGEQRRFEILSLKQGANDFAATIDIGADKGISVVATGNSFDLGPMMKSLDADSDESRDKGKNDPPLDVRFQLKRVRISEDFTVTDVGGQFRERAGKTTVLQASAQVRDGDRLLIDLKPGEGGRTLKIQSADAGAVIKALGITKDVVGGMLDIEGRFADEQPSAPLSGVARITDFKLLEAPVLARVISVAALTGIGDLLRGDGVAFTEARIPFVLNGPMLKVEGARAYGPSMGFTAEGTIDRKAETLALSGTLVPAYAINSVLGNIPVLGQILVGRKGEGIFGITYRMSGPFADPNVAVNPLSALTPGFLRRIFEFGEPGGAPPATPPTSPDKN